MRARLQNPRRRRNAVAGHGSADQDPHPLSPAQIAKDAAFAAISAIRKRAWETRRAKYGPRGHCGSYSR